MRGHPRFCRIFVHSIWGWTRAPLSGAIMVSFRTPTSLSYNSSSLIAHRLPKLCLRGRWWSWEGIPRKYVLFFDVLLICPVKSSSVLSNAKVLLFPHPSTLRLLPSRGEGLCKFIGGRSSDPWEVFGAFLTSKDKIKANGGWLQIYDFRLGPFHAFFSHFYCNRTLWTGYWKGRNLRIRDLNET